MVRIPTKAISKLFGKPNYKEVIGFCTMIVYNRWTKGKAEYMLMIDTDASLYRPILSRVDPTHLASAIQLLSKSS